MRCRTVRSLLPQYQDGDLPDRQATEVDEHLRTCEACAEELRQLEAVIDLVASLDEVDTSSAFTANVLASITVEDAQKVEEAPERSLLGLWLGAGGFAVTGVAAALLVAAFPLDLLSFSGVLAPLASTSATLLNMVGDSGLVILGALVEAFGAPVIGFLVADIVALAAILGGWKRLQSVRIARSTTGMFTAV